MADAAPAICLASSKRGNAMLASSPMMPHTKIRSMSAKPCALLIRTKCSVVSSAEPVPDRPSRPTPLESVTSVLTNGSGHDTKRQPALGMTNVDTNDLGRKADSLQPSRLLQTGRRSIERLSSRRVLAGAHQALAQAIDQIAVRGGKILEEAVDRFDDHAPLREAGDGAERIQPGLELHRHANTELGVVFDLFTFFGARRWPAGTTTIFCFRALLIRHGRVRWRGTSGCAHSAAHWTRAGIAELS